MDDLIPAIAALVLVLIVGPLTLGIGHFVGLERARRERVAPPVVISAIPLGLTMFWPDEPSTPARGGTT